MPTRLCAEPRCPNAATYRGRCPRHARTTNRATHNNKHIYNAKRWQLLRRRVLLNQPLCNAEGCDHISTDVDHVIAIEDGGQPWAMTNLQGLCASCHSTKTSHELQARRSKAGAPPWPTTPSTKT